MASDRAYVELPGDASFMRTHGIPNRRVDLPLVAAPRRGRLVATGLFCLILGAMASMSSMNVIASIGTARINSVAMFVLLMIVVSIFFVLGLFGLLIGKASLADAARPGSALELGPDGLRDRRLDLTLAWSQVTRVAVTGGSGHSPSLRLYLREPVEMRSGRFRPGATTDFRREPPGEFLLPLAMLDVPARTLAQVVLTLVREHGGAADPRSPAGETLVPILPLKPASTVQGAREGLEAAASPSVIEGEAVRARASDPTSVELPGEPGPTRTRSVPNRRVDLPLVAAPRRELLRLIGGSYVLIGLAWTWVCWQALPEAPDRDVLRNFVEHKPNVITLFAWSLFGVMFVLRGHRHLKNASRPGDAVELCPEGLIDARLDFAMPWPLITSARVVWGLGGVTGLLIQSRVPIEVDEGFRPKLKLMPESRRAILVPLRWLDVPARTLAQVALTLVRAHGGAVDPTRLDGVTVAPLLPVAPRGGVTSEKVPNEEGRPLAGASS